MNRDAAGSILEEAGRPLQDIGQGQGPNRIEWRSRVDDRPPALKNDFTPQFQKNQDVYVNGARGSLGPFKVDEVSNNGTYKLRKENGEKIKKTYEEGDLSNLPKLV
ncbi:MAG: hypothetical protein L6R39_001141 [Caloplaca ligustica]|nr:MAG: hypothetical protein L6R39_001141 [Caloplaca ligustica]